MKKVAIIDYGMSNLFSVQQACIRVGLQSYITSDKDDILSADAAVLPGVGAFGDAMQQLNGLGLSETIIEFVRSGKPFLGVCLGMQLLFTETEEFGKHKGLGIIQGRVRKFPSQSVKRDKIKVPQIGWNQVYPGPNATLWEKGPMKDTRIGEYMYFVHSFYVDPEDERVVLANTDYEGVTFCSAVQTDNICAFQFHPEKSGEDGIRIYEAWASFLDNV